MLLNVSIETAPKTSDNLSFLFLEICRGIEMFAFQGKVEQNIVNSGLARPC